MGNVAKFQTKNMLEWKRTEFHESIHVRVILDPRVNKNGNKNGYTQIANKISCRLIHTNKVVVPYLIQRCLLTFETF